MHYSLIKTVPAASEPITLADAKAYLRVDTSFDDTLIQSCIIAARQFVEDFTGLQLMPVTYQWQADMFPTVASQFLRFYDIRLWDILQYNNPLIIYLPRTPVSAINSISYIDPTGATQTLNPADPTQCIVDLNSITPRLTPAVDGVWPDTQNQMAAVTINFTAGFSGGAPTFTPALNTIPGTCMAAMRQIVADLYRFREINIEGRLAQNPLWKSLLYSERIWQCP